MVNVGMVFSAAPMVAAMSVCTPKMKDQQLSVKDCMLMLNETPCKAWSVTSLLSVGRTVAGMSYSAMTLQVTAGVLPHWERKSGAPGYALINLIAQQV